MKKVKLLFIQFLFVIEVFAQAPSIEWQKTYGGSGTDQGTSILQTSDGGYIFVGEVASTDGDVLNHHGTFSYDLWVVKIDVLGNIQWQKSLGGSWVDGAKSIVKTNDGGYIIAGNTGSTDDDVIPGTHGELDYWIVKINNLGDIQWQKAFGGSSEDYVSNIEQTSDGGYIIIGTTRSINGDVMGNHVSISSFSDCWVLKIDSLGNIEWQRCLGSTYLDYGVNIKQTTDGGYIIAGYVGYANGDVNYVIGGGDVWIVKLNNVGAIQWQNTYGGTSSDVARDIQQTSDGGYIFAGATDSNDGDVTSNHGGRDFWVVKLNSTGVIQWQKTLGSTGIDEAYSIKITNNGDYIIAGIAQKNDGDVTNHSMTPYDDYWIVKLNNIGNIQWQKSLGGSYFETPYCIQETNDGGYIIAGFTGSNDGDITYNHNDYDVWIVKLSSELPTHSFIINNIISIFPNPTKDILNIQVDNVNKINIIDLFGKNILSNENSNSINVLQLQKGIYIVQFESDGKTYNEKFIKD